MRVLLVQGPLMPEQMAHWEAASRMGVDLHVACARPRVEASVAVDADLHILQPTGWVRRGHLWWLYRGLGELVRSLRPDVIHVTAETYGLFFSQLDLRRQRVIGHAVDNLWVHGNPVEREIRLWRARRVLRRLAGLASWNRAGLELGHRFGFPESLPTVVVPGRIASPRPFERAAVEREAHRRRLGFGPAPVIGYLGRLVPEKGVDWLIESYAASSLPSRATLRVLGDGPSAPSLRQLAAGLGVDAHFGGNVAANDVPGVLAAFDVLVVPSVATPEWAEQFGRVIVEAMFAGTPVIASASGSIPEVVGEAGTLVPEGDRHALTDAMEKLIDDTTFRAELAGSGRRWAGERYAPDVLGSKLVSFWEAVTQTPGPA